MGSSTEGGDRPEREHVDIDAHPGVKGEERIQMSAVTAIARTAAVASLAVSFVVTAGFVRPTAAAAATTPPPVAAGIVTCDATSAPGRLLYIPAPSVKAINATAGTDKNTVRYWTRYYNFSTGAVMSDWVLGGVGTATDTTAAPFKNSGTIYGNPYAARYAIASGQPNVRAQYFVAWYNPTTGAVLAPSTPYVASYKLVTLTTTYIYGTGWVTVSTSSTVASC